MNSLAGITIDAHGGPDRWKQFEKVSADLVQGGVLWQVEVGNSAERPVRVVFRDVIEAVHSALLRRKS